MHEEVGTPKRRGTQDRRLLPAGDQRLLGHSVLVFLAAGTDPMRCFFFQAEDGIRDVAVTGVQTCALPISTLAFLRNKEGRPQLYLLPLGGGEAQQLTGLPKGASAAVWSPDGKTIAFTSTTTPEDLAKKDTTEKPKIDVRIITLAEFRADDEGYLDPAEHSHIWTVPAAMPGDEPAKARQVTTGAFDENTPQW